MHKALKAICEAMGSGGVAEVSAVLRFDPDWIAVDLSYGSDGIPTAVIRPSGGSEPIANSEGMNHEVALTFAIAALPDEYGAERRAMEGEQ